jgi:hypothetical protein
MRIRRRQTTMTFTGNLMLPLVAMSEKEEAKEGF